HEFEVKNMPVTVAVDVNGESVHQSGPEQWKEIILTRKSA
ncbi:MAG: fumarate hydratase class I, partial [Planctomycetota bacterium]